jgi:hypothetical protein
MNPLCEMLWSCKCFINWKKAYIYAVCLKYNCNFFHPGTHLNAAVMSMLKTKGSKMSVSEEVEERYSLNYSPEGISR